MNRVEWVVCKGCGKTGWLDIDKPMRETGWNLKTKFNDFTDSELIFHLCDECDCPNCSHAFAEEQADEGGTYIEYTCEFDDGWMCAHLQSSAPKVKTE